MPTEHVAQFYITINGQQMKPAHYDELQFVEVDDSLYLPDMFCFQFQDRGLEILKSDFYKPGQTIEISARAQASNANQAPSKVKLMEGEITSIEPDLNSSERSLLTIRGYDRSHRLTRERKTVTYLDVTDSDLAKKVAQRAGLSSQVTATSVVHKYVMQANQTDWEFLQERAQRVGYRLYVEGRILYFKKPEPSPAQAATIEWGINMDMFRPRLTTMEQPKEVTVRAWDPKQKRAVVGRASSPSSAMQYRKDADGKTGGAAVQSAFSIQSKQLVVDLPVTNDSDANSAAQAELDRAAANFIQAEGRTGGDPEIQAGKSVEIKGVGQRFNGKYLINRAIHHWSHNGYSIRFWASGGKGTTITELLGSGKGNGGGAYSHGLAAAKTTHTGVMVGVVTNNQDPDDMGRIKVKIPALGDTIESFWCRLLTPMAGPDRGMAYFPEADDEVAVMFENGDPTRGYILGAVWNGSDVVAKVKSTNNKLVTGSKTIRRVIKTRLGHEIVLDDSGEADTGIVICDKTLKNFIRIQTNNNKIVIQCEQDVEVTSNTSGNVTVEAKGANVTVKAAKNMTLQAGMNMDIKAGAKMTISGQTGVDVSSTAKTSVSGTAGLDLTSPAITNVKGGMVNLN